MPDLTAAQLVATRSCTATCLLAAGADNACGCPCTGRWHGALAGTPIPATAAWRTPHPTPQAGPHLLDLISTGGPHA